MVKLLGAVLVAAGCGWLGVQGARELKQRETALWQMADGLAALERELELNAPPLGRLLERAAARCRGPARELFRGCARGLDGLDEENLSALWRRLSAQSREMDPEGRELLAPLGEVLGRYDAEVQRAGVCALRRQVEDLARRRGEEYRRQGAVCRAVGLGGGAFLVILLL